MQHTAFERTDFHRSNYMRYSRGDAFIIIITASHSIHSVQRLTLSRNIHIYDVDYMRKSETVLWSASVCALQFPMDGKNSQGDTLRWRYSILVNSSHQLFIHLLKMESYTDTSIIDAGHNSETLRAFKVELRQMWWSADGFRFIFIFKS